MSRGRAALSLTLALVAAMALAACEQRAAPSSEPPEPVPELQVERARAACDDYIAKVCACAEAKPDDAEIVELCQLAGAKRSSLDMVLEVNRTTGSARESYKTADTVGRYLRSCVEGVSSLAARGCPR
ncbi:hypothetical protein [Haliangium ochraceum]|uniref:Lipoprotein n=1 Tax=Haliangium ochraceum (strain DSM 14365 / JCM 11303 / SMP-2) TaxID=502025 RepID=D0LUB5_HALO1|nr:hypothetical protein [Haliangium ochraceum]ACY19238.1 hypothetical protein Hoch_6774 [Haliangium ochraceum DSM 14365]